MDLFRRILGYARPYGRYWPPYLLLSILSLIFGIANYALLGPMLSVLFEQDAVTAAAASAPQASLSISYVRDLFSWEMARVGQAYGTVGKLVFVSLMLVAACLLANLCRYLSQRILVNVKTEVMQRLRSELFSKIASLDVGYFKDRRKGDLLSSLSNDVSEIQNSVAGSFHIIFREPVLVIGFLVMLFYMSARLTIVSLIALPITAFVVTRITRYLRSGSVETQSLLGDILSQFEEAVSGSRIIKAFNARGYVTDRFERTNRRHRDVSRRVFYRQELASPTSEFLGISVGAVVLFYGGWLNLHGRLGMSWEAFVVYIMFYWKVLEPAKAISKSFADIRRGLVSGQRVFSILDAEPAVQDAPDALPLEGFRQAIRFSGVSFSYPGTPVLRDIDLEIPKGSMVALVGPSGAGKSTMADLLPRFQDVSGGCITIDGVDIKRVRLEDLTALIGIVPQDPILFNDTVYANIAFGRPASTAEEVAEAARVAHADEFIDKMPQGYRTVIGDRGVKLSGGQRQRIAIARAVLKNPPILILDEATSSLDTENERLVQDALSHLMGGRTTLVIAHRLSTIRHADLIAVIHNGRIVERGTHESLTALGGIYSRLCELQEFSQQ